MPCVGCNIYFWGAAEQNRLLIECLGPSVAALRREGLARSFWFDRFDARSPHLLALITALPEAIDEVSRRLSAQVGDYLAARPSTDALSTEEIATRHAQTRGKALCSADTLPDLADNNSYLVFEQPSHGYPFFIGAGLREEEELWRLLDDLAFWAIDQLTAAPTAVPLGVAVRWIAGLDREVRRLGVAAGYWRHYATTLVVGLAERLAAGERDVIDSLPRVVGQKNLATFSRVWSEAESRPHPWPHLQRLVEIAFAGDEPAPVRGAATLREAMHCFLKQLGVPVSLHVPLVLFAWYQSARSPEVTRASPGVGAATARR
jgi:hypothetical protein